MSRLLTRSGNPTRAVAIGLLAFLVLTAALVPLFAPLLNVDLFDQQEGENEAPLLGPLSRALTPAEALTDGNAARLHNWTAQNVMKEDQRCTGAAQRRRFYVVYDPATGHSDVEPATTHERAKQLITGGLLATTGFRWPSLVAAKANHSGGEADDGSRDDEAKGHFFANSSLAQQPPQRHPDDVLHAYRKQALRETQDGPASPVSPVGNVRCARRNALVTVAAGYNAYWLQHFVGSFQRYHGPCDELVLMVDLEKVKGLVIDPFKSPVHLEDHTAWIPRSSVPVAIKRVEGLRKWLVHRLPGSGYHYVVTSDSRDVIFFANVFDALHSAGVVGLFSAQEARLLKECAMNHDWVRDFSNRASAGNGVSIAAAVAASVVGGQTFPVLCAGFYGGTATAMLDYLTVYVAAMKPLDRARTNHPLDQGAHNVLFSLGLARMRFPHPVVVLDSAVGPVRHWYFPQYEIVHDRLGRHMNCVLEPYALVHQLDRYGERWEDAMRPYRPAPGGAAEAAGPDTACAASRAVAAVTTTAGTPVDNNAPRSSAPSAVMPPLETPPHYTTTCTARNALLVYVRSTGGGNGTVSMDTVLVELAMTLGAFQRHHTRCDTAVVFLPANVVLGHVWRAVPFDESSGAPPVLWRIAMTTGGGTAEASAARLAQEYLGGEAAATWSKVVVLQLGGMASARRSLVFANLFARGDAVWDVVDAKRRSWEVPPCMHAWVNATCREEAAVGMLGGPADRVAQHLRLVAEVEARIMARCKGQGKRAEESVELVAWAWGRHRLGGAAPPMAVHLPRRSNEDVVDKAGEWRWSEDGKAPRRCNSQEQFPLVVVSVGGNQTLPVPDGPGSSSLNVPATTQAASPPASPEDRPVKRMLKAYELFYNPRPMRTIHHPGTESAALLDVNNNSSKTNPLVPVLERWASERVAPL